MTSFSIIDLSDGDVETGGIEPCNEFIEADAVKALNIRKNSASFIYGCLINI